MSNWFDQIVEIYDPSDLSIPKVIMDNGRTVDHLLYISAEGSWEKNKIGTGSFELDVSDRDANPYISKGDIAHCSVKSAHRSLQKLTVACFIVETFKQNDDGTGKGTLVVSGKGIGKELTRKLFTDKYIMGEITGEAREVIDNTANNDDYLIDLEVGHGEVDDYYKGDVVQIGAFYGQIASYQTSVSRLRVNSADWTPFPPPEQSNVPYIIYKGNSYVDIEKALGPTPLWLSNTPGTVNGTMHTNVGKYVWDVINDISDQSGQFFRFNASAPTRYIYFEQGVPIPSGVSIYGFDRVDPDYVAVNIFRSYTLNVERTIEIATAYTRLYGAGAGVSLADLPEAARYVPDGFSIYADQSLIVYDDGEEGQHISETVEKFLEYNDIAPRNEFPEAKGDAAVILRDSMVSDLRKNNPNIYHYSFDTILRVDLQILDQLYLDYRKETRGTGEQNWAVQDDLYIHKITHRCSPNTKGARETSVDVYDRLDYEYQDGTSMVADLLKRQSYGSSGGLTVFGTGGSGPSDPYYGGNNIDVDDNIISLSQVVAVEDELSTPEFFLMDFGEGQMRKMYWKTVRGRLRLFAEKI